MFNHTTKEEDAVIRDAQSGSFLQNLLDIIQRMDDVIDELNSDLESREKEIVDLVEKLSEAQERIRELKS